MQQISYSQSIVLGTVLLVLLVGASMLTRVLRDGAGERRIRRLEAALARGDARGALSRYLDVVDQLVPTLAHQAPATASTRGLSRRLEVVEELCRLDPAVAAAAAETGYLDLLREELETAQDGSSFSGLGYSPEGLERFNRIGARLNEATDRFHERCREIEMPAEPSSAAAS